jgi:hypothetical protein
MLYSSLDRCCTLCRRDPPPCFEIPETAAWWVGVSSSPSWTLAGRSGDPNRPSYKKHNRLHRLPEVSQAPRIRIQGHRRGWSSTKTFAIGDTGARGEWGWIGMGYIIRLSVSCFSSSSDGFWPGGCCCWLDPNRRNKPQRPR